MGWGLWLRSQFGFQRSTDDLVQVSFVNHTMVGVNSGLLSRLIHPPCSPTEESSFTRLIREQEAFDLRPPAYDTFSPGRSEVSLSPIMSKPGKEGKFSYRSSWQTPEATIQEMFFSVNRNHVEAWYNLTILIFIRTCVPSAVEVLQLKGVLSPVWLIQGALCTSPVPQVSSDSS